MYASLPANARADAFSCRLCPELRQAFYWDHCHDHGFVRGPLCPRCNTSEGGPGFLKRPGSVEHLLQCNGCRRKRTVPRQHHPDIVRGAYVLAPHPSCTHQPSTCWGAVEEDGSVRFQLSCWQHTPVLEWERFIPADEVRHLVKEFVDKALEADPDLPVRDSD
nr:endonuclease domain-containing protein [Streptomyces gossypiisoli]